MNDPRSMPAAPTGSSQDSRLPQLGTIVGNCRLTSLLGEGAIGIVYKAFEVDLEIERAIKMLKPDAIDYVRRKFEAEAKVTARLDHASIVKVHGGGIWDGRLPFMQMEYIDGKSLRLLLTAHTTFHPVVCLSIVCIITGALEYAWNQSFSIWGESGTKLVHRDLKPENILISKSGVLKVMDFGLAQLGTEKTQSGWGTPQYMSPEQHGHVDVDCRSDIYSLGAILYEMLCGIRPFGDDLDAIAAAKKKADYKPVHHFRPSVPDEICAIVDKCLHPDREKRFRTCESLQLIARNALAEMTPRPPEDEIRAFAENPEAFVPVKLEKAGKTPAGFVPKLLKWLAPVCVVGLFGALAWMVITATGNDSPMPDASAADRIAPQLQDSAPAEITKSPNASLRAPHVPPRPKTVPSKQQDTTLRNHESGRPAASVKPRPAPELKHTQDAGAHASPKPIRHSILRRAIAAYKQKQFTAAIASINSLALDELAPATRDSAVILLADCYYQTRSIQELIALSKRYAISDARYNTVLSLAFEIVGDQVLAAEYIDKAIISPARLWKQERSDLLYKRATLYRRRYRSARSDAGRKNMLDAYRLFISESCRQPSGRCDEAKKVVQEHER
ncbi:MAG: protein kinase [Chitinivibrionales bacterium]|nr:protein kinase [Chitinivibrionales bacterium]